MDDGLGDQDAVERIAVERRELGDLEGGLLVDGERIRRQAPAAEGDSASAAPEAPSAPGPP